MDTPGRPCRRTPRPRRRASEAKGLARLPPRASSPPSLEATLKARVNTIATWARCTSEIQVVVVDRGTIADAAGSRVGSALRGRIRIHEKLVAMFTAAQLDFVLGHEVGHMFLNHLPQRASVDGLRASLEARRRREPVVDAALGVWDVARLVRGMAGGLTPAALLVREQEYAADRFAVQFQGHIGPAVSCLTALAGLNVDQASHSWSVGPTSFSVMSMRDRIQQLWYLVPPERLQLSAGPF